MDSTLNMQNSDKPLTWTHEYLITVLTTGRDPLLKNPMYINAFNQLDRRHFITEDYHHIAYEDKNIPINYGEVLTNPFTIAKILNILEPGYGQRYIEIGSGVGYLAALIGMLTGSQGRVYGLERIQWLWERSRENIRKFRHLNHVELLYRDGSDALLEKSPYDGIIYSTIPQEVSNYVYEQLAINGKMLIPTHDHNIRVVTRIADDQFEEEIVPDVSAFAFGKLKQGRA